MEKYEFSREERLALEGMRIPLAVYQYIDKRVVTVLISDGFLDTFGYKDRETAVYDMDYDMYFGVHPDDIAGTEEAAIRFATEDGKYEAVYRTKKKTGSEYCIVHAFGEHVTAPDGTRLAYVWYVDEGNYSEGEANEKSLVNRVLTNSLRENSMVKEIRYDYLTGLPSMTYFFDLAASGRDRILAEGGRPALLFIDFSGFKFYNYKYGFEQGDKFLQSFSKVVSQLFGSENCSHIGQDRFTVLAEETDLEPRIERMFREVNLINGGEILAVRVGIYHDNDSKTIPVSVACDRAKIACDSLKGEFESTFTYYVNEQKEKIIKKQYILENFQSALDGGWIEVYYQPIIRAVNGHVCDEEALSRWHDPEKGMLSPADFIPALEESNVIYKLDLYVLESVLEKIGIQREHGLYIVPHSINLSRSDFNACDIVEEIRKRVDGAGVERRLITIEITESAIASDFDFMKEQIERFRALGFRVWMDDFGSGYSSLDVLQNIEFDLIKFDMNFLMKSNEGDRGRIILTELVKLAESLGLDTVCEGVETEEQARFLKEISCSKLQGYYYSKPIPFHELLKRYDTGGQIGYENPEESAYYKAVGAVTLYDISVIASQDENAFKSSFNTLPMGIIEIRGEDARFVRSNKSYREFVKRYLGFDLTIEGSEFVKSDASFVKNVIKTCCEIGVKSFYDETMPGGAVVRSFARRVGINPVNGNIAVAVGVISITEPSEGTTYADIARALAADYYNIYYVDLDTEKFIEYSSPVGAEELAMERHGENFFEECRQAAPRIYEEDRAVFYDVFTKEKVIKELDEQGVFTTTYRLVDKGYPMYVNMKITRMPSNRNRIIMGISIIDSQMKHRENIDEIHKEMNALTFVNALAEGYLSMYVVNPDTGKYLEFSATKEYETLGFEKEGEDFFAKGISDGKRTVYSEDLAHYIENFTKEKVLDRIEKEGVYILHYRLVIGGVPKRVSLRIAKVTEDGREKLVAGVRAWVERQ